MLDLTFNYELIGMLNNIYEVICNYYQFVFCICVSFVYLFISIFCVCISFMDQIMII